MKNAMKESISYKAGPYRGYFGFAEFDGTARLFHGEIIGTRDVITFQARTSDELGQAFQDSVDDYLNHCKAIGKEPNKPFSGNFVTRVDPELHHQLSVRASVEGKSLNQLIGEWLTSLVGAPTRGSRTAKKSKGTKGAGEQKAAKARRGARP